MDSVLVIVRQFSYYSWASYLLAFGVSLLIHFGGSLIRWLFLSVLTSLHSVLHPLSADNRRLVAEVEAGERELLALHPMRYFVSRARLERRLVVLHAERDSRLAPRVAVRARLEMLRSRLRSRRACAAGARLPDRSLLVLTSRIALGSVCDCVHDAREPTGRKCSW